MKKVFILVLLLSFGWVLYGFGVSTYENIQINDLINDYKKIGKLVYEETGRRYYEIDDPKYPNFHISDNLSIFSDDSRKYLGIKGDIIVSRQSSTGVKPIDEFVKYFTGGHAVLVDDNNYIYEAIGFSGDNTLDMALRPKETPNMYSCRVVRSSNYLLSKTYRSLGDQYYDKYSTYYRNEYFGLRVKDASEEDRNKALEFAKYQASINAAYKTFFFIGPNNSYYCSSIVDSAYASIKNEDGKEKFTLNSDSFVVTINDLILSRDTYLSYYFYLDKDGIENFYYLKGGVSFK